MGVRDRLQLVQSTPSDIIEVSSLSSYSSNESLYSDLNMVTERERQEKSRRNLKGWLKKNKKTANCNLPTAETHMKKSSSKNSRRAGRLKGQLSCLSDICEEWGCGETQGEGGAANKPLDIYSFVDSTSSAFTSVVSDPALLQDWNERQLQQAVHHKMRHESGEVDEATYDWCTDFDGQKLNSLALSPNNCYRRIGKSARSQLNMPHKHHEALKDMEQELIDWFSAFPDSVMIKCMKSGYDRLLFHSVCRYMNLSSYSVHQGEMKSVNKCEKKTYVQNNWSDFNPPTLLLSEYLPKLSLANEKEPADKKHVEIS